MDDKRALFPKRWKTFLKTLYESVKGPGHLLSLAVFSTPDLNINILVWCDWWQRL
jgi:hypothetical protein